MYSNDHKAARYLTARGNSTSRKSPSLETEQYMERRRLS